MANLSNKKEVKNTINRRKFVTEEGYDERKKVRTSISSRYLESSLNEKKRRSAERSEARRQRQARAKRNGKNPFDIDWDSIDQKSQPEVSFEPNDKNRRVNLEVLRRKPRDLERKRLLSKLGTEFSRIYTRYRKAAERQRYSYSHYKVESREKKYAVEAGMWCFMKNVTPRNLLEYWDANIGTFANSRMQLPPLGFLRHPANIDTAACSSLSGKSKEAKIGRRGRMARIPSDVKKPFGGNSFSDTDGLDARLRSSLEKAGFDTTAYNDRFLMTVQSNAATISSGRNVFMGKGVSRDMARWAAKNLYGDHAND